LAAKSLSALPVFSVVEQVIQKTHAYFNKSPKRFCEYQKLAEDMETRGLKPLLQVTTRWVSLLEPLRRLLADYRTLLAKIKADCSKNDAAEVCYSFSPFLCMRCFQVVGFTVPVNSMPNSAL